jgi:hypothetical protein
VSLGHSERVEFFVVQENMETKTILSAALVVAYGLTHVVVGADVPGKPLTMLTAAVSSPSSAATPVVPNMANPYGEDFKLPLKDTRPTKATIPSS